MVFLDLGASAVLPFTRYRFTVEGAPSPFSQSAAAFAGAIGVGIELR